jgi:hypothetical protein
MTMLREFAFACAFSALALGSATAQTTPATSEAEYVPQSGQEGKDVVWVPSPQALVDRMLDMANVTTSDYLVDLGSGDGRTVITAAKRGVRAHGIEFNPKMVALSQRAAKTEGVAETATFVEGDIFESDFSKATVVTMFLLPELNVRLRPTLLEMPPGTRVVSNSFDMADWTPDQEIRAGDDCKSYCRAMMWIIPAKVAGNWRLGDSELELAQSYQMLSGTLSRGGQAMPISDAKMNGAEISFTAGGQRYVGVVNGSKIDGKMENGSTWSASREAS